MRAVVLVEAGGYERARAKNEAIWARVTGWSGQYRRGEVEHPAVTPAVRRASAARIVASGWLAISSKIPDAAGGGG